jgi:hypothetical protein
VCIWRRTLLFIFTAEPRALRLRDPRRNIAFDIRPETIAGLLAEIVNPGAFRGDRKAQLLHAVQPGPAEEICRFNTSKNLDAQSHPGREAVAPRYCNYDLHANGHIGHSCCMTPRDVSVYLSGLCGLIMVCGSIWLLATGIIELADKGRGRDGEALSVDIQKIIKITTAFPALGLFLVGLLFVWLAMRYSEPVPVSWNVVGKIVIDDPSRVTVVVQPDNSTTFSPDTTGEFDKDLSVDIHRILLTVNAAGYEPPTQKCTLSLEKAAKGTLKLEKPLVFSKPVAPHSPEPVVGTIEPVPDGIKLPPLLNR